MSIYRIPKWAVELVSTPKIVDRLKPVPHYWYQDKDGNKIIPDLHSDEAVAELEAYMKKGYTQHLLMPKVTESIINDTGTIGEFNTTINGIEPIVMHLVSSKGWKLVDAITIASEMCPRCQDLIENEIAGKVCDSKEHNTHCDLCNIIDPIYDKNYKEKTKDLSKEAALKPETVLKAFLDSYKIRKKADINNSNKCAIYRAETNTCMNGCPQTGVQRGRECPFINDEKAKACKCYRT